MSTGLPKRLIRLACVLAVFMLALGVLLPPAAPPGQLALAQEPDTPGGLRVSSPVTPSLWLPMVAKNVAPLPPIIPPTTEVLSGETTEHLSSISPDGAAFTFSETTPELTALAPSEVIVGGVTTAAPNGFLRRVSSVSTTGGHVVVRTTSASLEDAIQQGEVHLSRVLTPDDIAGASYAEGVSLAAPRATAQLGTFFLKVEDVELYGDQIVANGSIELSPTLDLDLTVRDWRLEQLYFATTVVEKSELKVEAKLELLQVKKEVELARYYLNPIIVMVGPVPIVFVSVLTFVLGVDGKVHAGVTTGVTQNASFTSGLQYRDGAWSPVAQRSNQFQFIPPTLFAGLDLKGYTGARLSLLIYGVVGPSARTSLYLKLEAATSESPWWQLYGGLEVVVGVRVEVLSRVLADYEAFVIGYKVVIAQAPNTPSSPSPVDGAANQGLDVNLGWAGGDAGGDAVTYDVYFEAGDSSPDVLVSNDQSATGYSPGTLVQDAHYYWKIVATDEHGASAAGPVWDFATSAPLNHAPNTPSSPSPVAGATNQSLDVDLGWAGGDPDGDAVTYDVYFEAGDGSPDVLVSNDQSATGYNPGGLAQGTHYYWQIRATDAHSASTTGPVWQFTTTIPLTSTR